MADVLSPEQLKRLTEHKYSAVGTSISEAVMQKFWRWLVEQVPLWWAPNAITLAGLAVNIITCLILVFYSPDARQVCPSWTYLLFALGLFIYQTLDAIDGKQARRTNSSSPLGELFDHGCDALSTVFVMIGTTIGMQLGEEPDWMFFMCFVALTLFYVAHWQAYVSGTLRFGFVDVTEAQMSVMFVHIVSAILGPGFWANKVPIIGYSLRQLVVISSFSVSVFSMRDIFRIIFMEGGSGKNGATIADTSVIFPIFPIAWIVGLALVISKKSTTALFQNHPALYIIAFGMVSAKITGRLVVAHMTKSEMGLLDSILIGPGMLVLNQYFNTILNEYLVLWMCLFYSSIDLLRYCVAVCVQICDYLNIYCFHITPPNPTEMEDSPVRKRPRTRSWTREHSQEENKED